MWGGPPTAPHSSPFPRLGLADDRDRVCRSVAGEVAADDEPLDLVGAFEDLHDFGFAHVAFDGEVARVAVAAEDLDCVGGDAHRVVGGDEFGDGRFFAVGQAGVFEAGGMPSRPASREDSAIDRPWPSAPMRWSAGMRTPSKRSMVVCEAVSPIFRSGRSALRPGVSAGTRKQEMPRERSSLVRAMTV